MKKFLLFLFFLIFSIVLQAQQGVKENDRVAASSQKEAVNIKIYPVPVTNNSFTIEADKDIEFVKITNIIGQDIFKSKYSNSQQPIHVTLNAPQRGMYLVTIIFHDSTRIVKKIMIEESK